MSVFDKKVIESSLPFDEGDGILRAELNVRGGLIVGFEDGAFVVCAVGVQTGNKCAGERRSTRESQAQHYWNWS